jgi:hypothetical protein
MAPIQPTLGGRSVPSNRDMTPMFHLQVASRRTGLGPRHALSSSLSCLTKSGKIPAFFEDNQLGFITQEYCLHQREPPNSHTRHWPALPRSALGGPRSRRVSTPPPRRCTAPTHRHIHQSSPNSCVGQMAEIENLNSA